MDDLIPLGRKNGKSAQRFKKVKKNSLVLGEIEPAAEDDGLEIPVEGPSKPVATTPLAPPSTTDSDSLLSEHEEVGRDEVYGNDEQQLNQFLKLHPMLSNEAATMKTLKLAASVFEKSFVQVSEVPIIPRTYDDTFLCPPNKKIGERECACGENCICAFLAKWRYGEDTDYKFIGKEFLLPAEFETFKSGNGLPARPKKCLVCTRYYQTYVYTLARLDPHFNLSTNIISTQNFGNELDPQLLSDTLTAMPVAASETNSKTGYPRSAMIFVDEQFASKKESRAEMKNMLWKPVVKFMSTDYKYHLNDDKNPYMTQHFQRPSDKQRLCSTASRSLGK